ncbi:MAG: matrixin family metalloprotease [Acidobacteria bacterium]|nr:matrixin family metalloprotease [Acidobacteriota bacterium]
MRALWRAAALLPLLALGSSAYYHFVHFRNGQRVVERYDLDELVDQTLDFYVSLEQAPRLSSNDSFEGVLSQIRQALSVWDSVSTSALRVRFGGVIEGDLPGSGPAGEIVFAELPPGVLGMSSPTTFSEVRGDFRPIRRSQVILSSELAQGSRPRQSFSELFFGTLVHEIGHALGLQHTIASAAMSTDVTRGTSRARPLSEDDIAGVSLLYPTSALARQTGSIEGRVTATSGGPVALASVVAVHPGGAVVSALTDPDGTYELAGLLPGAYRVYVHALPPASLAGAGPANVVLPESADGVNIAAGPSFYTQFYGGRDRPEASPRVDVAAGQVRGATDFQVRLRDQVGIYNVTTYSFPGNGAPGVHPAFLHLTRNSDFLLGAGQNLTQAASLLTVEPLDAPVEIQAGAPHLYSLDQRFVQLDFAASPFAAPGPLHLLFRTPDDLYVLPWAATLASEQAPIIYFLTPDFLSGGAVWRLRGDNLEAGSQVYFDGRPAKVLDYEPDFQELLVEPPPGPPGHRAVVTVYNPDGQSSALTLPDGNAMFEYPSGPALSFRLSPDSIASDEETVIEITSDTMELSAGDISVGFGSSDVVVRRVQVVDAHRLLAVVAAAPGDGGNLTATVVSGIQTAIQTQALQVTGAALTTANRPALRYGGLVNSASGQPDLAPGVLASLFGRSLTVAGRESEARVTIGGQPAQVLAASEGQINLVIPEGLASGAVEYRVFNGEAESAPMLADLRATAPGVFRAVTGNDLTLSKTVEAGISLGLLCTGIGDGDSAAVVVVANGLRLTPTAIERTPTPGVWVVRFQLPAALNESSRVFLALWAGGRRSNTVLLPDGLLSGVAPTLQPSPGLQVAVR